jgi:hypothetical protein
MTEPIALKKNTFNPYLPGLILLFLSVVIAFLCYKEYGISWDEPAQRGAGRVTYNYVTNGDNTPKDLR